MTEGGRQVQSLIREFRCNQLKYKQQIGCLRSTVKTMQLEIQQLNFYIKTSNSKEMLPAPRDFQTPQLQNQLKIIIKYVEQNMQQFTKRFNAKLNSVQGKVIHCEQSIQEVRFTRWPFMIDDLQKQLVQKDRDIERQGQVIDKTTAQKSHSQIIFNRQIKFLQRLANEKEELCTRLQQANHQLREQNSILKEEAKQKKSPFSCKTVGEVSLQQSPPICTPSSELVQNRLTSRTRNLKLKTSVNSKSQNKIVPDVQHKQLQSNSREKRLQKSPLIDRQQN